MAYPNTQPLPSAALAAFRRDMKKTVVLVVLVMLLGFLAFRTFGSGGPQRAAAAVTAAAAAVGEGQRGGSGNNADAQRPSKGMGVNPHLDNWAQAPISPISRNLFAIRLEYFPVEGPRNGAGAPDRGEDGFWAKLEKSLVLQADQRDKRENQRANYMARAAQLKLQSTMMGPQPKALVNGELVGEGDVVAEFRVVKIEARRVIVEREGIRLEILMK
jgi:hypothetical protein